MAPDAITSLVVGLAVLDWKVTNKIVKALDLVWLRVALMLHAVHRNERNPKKESIVAI